MRARTPKKPPIDPIELIGGEITDLKFIRNDGTRVAVYVDDQRTCVIDADDIDRLRLSTGLTWTDDLCAHTLDASAFQKARRSALNMLGYAARSRADLVRRLVMKKHDREVARRVVDLLAERGLVDDEEFAVSFVRAELSRAPAGDRLLEAKLRTKGVDANLARRVIDEALGGRDELEDALQVARKHARTLPPNLEPDARKRRILGKLARRGFSPPTAFEAVKQVLNSSE